MLAQNLLHLYQYVVVSFFTRLLVVGLTYVFTARFTQTAVSNTLWYFNLNWNGCKTSIMTFSGTVVLQCLGTLHSQSQVMGLHVWNIKYIFNEMMYITTLFPLLKRCISIIKLCISRCQQPISLGQLCVSRMLALISFELSISISL